MDAIASLSENRPGFVFRKIGVFCMIICIQGDAVEIFQYEVRLVVRLTRVLELDNIILSCSIHVIQGLETVSHMRIL